ncbi:MAG: Desulfoferrodoxin, N-terminal domain [Frankiales bacterium]|nr:Desulfoferrodoxin, N-terminal domain [Frankiales bacterium]
MASELGKRYECPSCGGQLLVVAAGTGQVLCCGVEVDVLQPKKLPSSD